MRYALINQRCIQDVFGKAVPAGGPVTPDVTYVTGTIQILVSPWQGRTERVEVKLISSLRCILVKIIVESFQY